MHVLSVNVGMPVEVEWRGERVLTSIFKKPVRGRIRVGSLNLAGDAQSDLASHGGRFKAVYVYSSEHYPHWREQFPELDLPWGVFGENLTTEGLVEDGVRIGDRFRVGSAEITVAQPRIPCYKLGIRFGQPDIVKRFQASGLSGVYFEVTHEGELGPGDDLVRVTTDADAPSISDITALFRAKAPDRAQLERAAALPSLGPEWRNHFLRRLD